MACVGSLQVALNSSAATTAAPEDDEAAESCNRTCQQLIGIAFVLVGEVAVFSRASLLTSLNLIPLQFFHGCQFVYEEKYVIKYDLHPLKVVGYEGDISLSVRLYGCL